MDTHDGRLDKEVIVSVEFSGRFEERFSEEGGSRRGKTVS